MDIKKKVINLKIRRYDLSDYPEIIHKSIELPYFIDYNTMKTNLTSVCGIEGEKVIKIRNEDGILVPISFFVDSNDSTFIIDVANVSYTDKNQTNSLQDAYVDAVQQKIKTLESRISQSEFLLPQLEWRRQAYMEETVSALTNKVVFLNRRFDELFPQHKRKLAETTP